MIILLWIATFISVVCSLLKVKVQKHRQSYIQHLVPLTVRPAGSAFSVVQRQNMKCASCSDMATYGSSGGSLLNYRQEPKNLSFFKEGHRGTAKSFRASKVVYAWRWPIVRTSDSVVKNEWSYTSVLMACKEKSFMLAKLKYEMIDLPITTQFPNFRCHEPQIYLCCNIQQKY
jgi:hypothetical protein